jgi:hypothetical protein
MSKSGRLPATASASRLSPRASATAAPDRELSRQSGARSGSNRNAVAALARDGAIAVVLDFVNPLRPGRSLCNIATVLIRLRSLIEEDLISARRV